ncbi:hypothetical protein BAUCODRAFT_128939 [Baudoinia panamericana UAMH 10762]|uniref:Lysyl-tRNA synthetase n=1 Tax=Baudoinia panamericana (strain UAMH 10762) TaxID=717646 RepID=M2LVC2_BAUPA|nr:uncharacterized protein BAUCODRAFT_128939 [Baudoinia panamericana UAMH 10762]EMC98567.1 hypothetical protein BAUCODRAFT_128939 [Baudoinia panamericana UAMH 10762]
MSACVIRRLRPYLFHGFERSQGRAFSCGAWLRDDSDSGRRSASHDYVKRVSQLQSFKKLEECYPRLPFGFPESRVPISDFRSRYDGMLEAGQTVRNSVDSAGNGPLIVAGRIRSVRTAGNKLVFLDIYDGSASVQVVVGIGLLDEAGTQEDCSKTFKDFTRTVRKGDWYASTGWPHRTRRGELSLLATQVPQLLSPSLHQLPESLEDAETRARNRHVDMLVNPVSTLPLHVRHHIEQCMNAFFDDRGFIKVSTPLLTAGAGGAVARPFETEATELEGQKLNLRIAPELWLKRLVVGGMDKVYELGPAFRNEGVDATHNPEFSICEFYEAFATLDELMLKTEQLLGALQERFTTLRSGALQNLPALAVNLIGSYQRHEFIPTLEQQMGRPLPDLLSPSAHKDLLAIFAFKGIITPENATIPRLLDALASHYLEPLCHNPTFITHHPAALSPLSKQVVCPTTGQTVAARAELFIKGREYANMYEEENSPFAQRRKFEDQLKYRAEDREGGERDLKGEVDESYLEALEWGLPPTGGWGCGMDRLVMLFSGRERIGEVLAFGTLRNVVGLGRKGR